MDAKKKSDHQSKADRDTIADAIAATQKNRERIAKAKAQQDRLDADPTAHPGLRRN